MYILSINYVFIAHPTAYIFAFVPQDKLIPQFYSIYLLANVDNMHIQIQSASQHIVNMEIE